MKLNQILQLALVVLLLVGSNELTHIQTNRITKKEKKAMQKSLDSLQSIFDAKELIHAQEELVQQEARKRDSLLIVSLQKIKEKEDSIIAKQEQVLSSYKKLNKHEIKFKLDSAFKAAHN